MSHIHFAGAILQATQVQRQQEVQRSRDLRRQQELDTDIAEQDEQLEHQVEAAEAPTSTRTDPADTAPAKIRLNLTA